MAAHASAGWPEIRPTSTKPGKQYVVSFAMGSLQINVLAGEQRDIDRLLDFFQQIGVLPRNHVFQPSGVIALQRVREPDCRQIWFLNDVSPARALAHRPRSPEFLVRPFGQPNSSPDLQLYSRKLGRPQLLAHDRVPDVPSFNIHGVMSDNNASLRIVPCCFEKNEPFRGMFGGYFNRKSGEASSTKRLQGSND